MYSTLLANITSRNNERLKLTVVLSTWIALAGSLGIVLPSGGSVAFLYGFIFVVACNFCIGASLGEMAAIWPTAGGQYHFVWALCTEKWKKLMVRSLPTTLRLYQLTFAQSFWVGWTNIAGWVTLVTTEGFFAAQFISAAAVLASNGAYVIQQWRTYLIFLAILCFTTISNIFGNKILGRWNDGACESRLSNVWI